MHPRTQFTLTQLQRALADAARLERRLQRAAACNPPVYWQLDPAVLKQIEQLKEKLEREIIALSELSKM